LIQEFKFGMKSKYVIVGVYEKQKGGEESGFEGKIE
jgi:hypothetical protein